MGARPRDLAVFLAALAALPVACASFRNGDVGGADAGPDAAGADASAGADAPMEAATDAGHLEAAPTDASGDTGPGDGGDASEGGVCTPTTCSVSTVIGGLYGPAALAVDATHLYWLEVGTTIPQAGGEGQLVRLAKGTTCADRSCVEIIDPYALSGTFEGQLIYDNQLALSPAQVCYAQSFNAQSSHQISCFDLQSLGQIVVDSDYGDCDGVYLGPSSILWSLASTTATSNDGSLRTRGYVATDGGSAPAVASGRPNPTSVLGDGTGVVWTETGTDAGGSVMALEPDGGLREVAGGRGGPVAIAEYGGYLYWIDATARRVSRTPRAGGGAVDLLANTDANPFALIVDASGIYWAAAGLTAQQGSVGHAPLGPGGPTTVMLDHVDGIQALAVDATTVYAAALGPTVNGGGSIVGIPKSH